MKKKFYVKLAAGTPMIDRRGLVPLFKNEKEAVDARPSWLSGGMSTVVQVPDKEWEIFKATYPCSEEKSPGSYRRALKNSKPKREMPKLKPAQGGPNPNVGLFGDIGWRRHE